jgi:prepilin-type N-terminal cleavage/methylation domain-containing protein
MIQRAKFSMLELMIVLAIMGLVLGMAIASPRLVPAGIQTKRAMKAINIAFHTASSRALSTGTTMKLTFDFESSKVTITGVGGSGGRSASGGGQSDTNSPVARHFAKYGNFELPAMVKLNESRLSRDWAETETTVYYFYSNGEAVGPTLPLLVNDMLEVDIDVVRLTGKPIYVEYD